MPEFTPKRGVGFSSCLWGARNAVILRDYGVFAFRWNSLLQPLHSVQSECFLFRCQRQDSDR